MYIFQTDFFKSYFDIIYANKIRGWSLKSIAIILNLMFENYKLDKTILIKSILKK